MFNVLIITIIKFFLFQERAKISAELQRKKRKSDEAHKVAAVSPTDFSNEELDDIFEQTDLDLDIEPRNKES